MSLFSTLTELMEDKLGTQSRQAQPEDEAMAVKALANDLDVDKLGEQFRKFAGHDDCLSKDEFDQFCVEVKISTAVGKQLWAILDRDGSGTVSKDEFHAALLSMQASRRWIRFCPSCEYRNDCPFCAECNSSCPRCNEVAFCAACWSDHPGRQQTLDEMDEDQKIDHPFGSVEHLREHLVIRPLEWAYHSKALRPVPVQYKAGLRQLLYAQKKAAADAAVAMNEAALDG